MSIKELKKKGYSLKEIGKLAELFYQKQEKESRISPEFMEIISKLVKAQLKEKKQEKTDIRSWMKEFVIISSQGVR